LPGRARAIDRAASLVDAQA